MNIYPEKITYKLKLAIALAVLLFVLAPKAASAASVKVSSSGGTVETGNTVTVTVTLSSSDVIGGYRIYMTYDSSIIEYVPQAGDDNFCNGGSGTLTFVGDPYATSSSCSIKFKALKAGTSKLSMSYDAGDVLDSNGDDMSVSVSSGSVTVNAPREASTDATLSSLKIGDGKFTPDFSSNVTEYSMNVSADTDALTISATPNSQYAKVSVKDNSLSEGENTVRIVVTAENGSQKTYYIHVNKAAATPTPSPEPTATPTETPIPTQGVTVPAKHIAVDDSGNASVKEEELTVSDVITAEIPVGFDKTTATVSGVTVEALKLNDGDVTLIQLSDGSLYVYDSENSSCTKYQTASTAVRNFRIGFADESIIPEGYVLTSIQIAGEAFPAYANSADSVFVLVFVEGTTWYSYDTQDGTFQRYLSEDEGGSAITGIPSDDGKVSPLPTSTPSVSGESKPSTVPVMADAGKSDSKIFLIIIVITSVLCIAFVILYLKERGKNRKYAEPEEDMEDEDYEDEFDDYSSEESDYEDDGYSSEEPDYEADGSSEDDFDE